MTEPTRSPDNYHDATEHAPTPELVAVWKKYQAVNVSASSSNTPTAWAHRYTRSEVSMDVGDAWRACRAECKRRAYQYAANLRASVEGEENTSAYITRCNADAIEMCADQFDRIEPRAEATGLCERGA